MKAIRRPFTSAPRASRGPSCMLPKQGITGLRMNRAIQEWERRTIPATLKPQMHVVPAALKLGLCRGSTIQELRIHPSLATQ